MKWSEWLIKRSIDESLFDSKPSDTAEERVQLADLRDTCCRELTTSESVRQLRAELKNVTGAIVASNRTRDILSEVREELGEIIDDLRFARSRRGRFVLFCNDWGQELNRTVRSQLRFDDTYVGAHVSSEAVVVAGHVPDATALQDLRAIIEAHPPGVEVVWKVAIGRQK